MKWIKGKYTDDDHRFNDWSVKCSHCGWIKDYPSKYCPNCGEAEDKNKEIQ